MGAGFNLYFELASFNSGNLHFGSKCSCREVEQQVVDDVLPIANKRVVALFFDVNLYVSTDTVVLSGVAFSWYVDHHSFSHASGDVDFHHFIAFHDTRSTTFVAFVLDDSTFSVARRTFSLSLHHAEHRANGLYHIALSVTIRTGFRATTSFGTSSVTMLAGDVFPDFEFLGNAVGNLVERKTHFQPKVGTTILGVTSSATTTEASESSTKAVAAKDIAKHREDVVHREAATTEASESSTHVGAVESELVVLLAFLLVAQHAISLGSFFKFLLSLFVARVAVGMVFDGNLSIRLLYLVF